MGKGLSFKIKFFLWTVTLKRIATNDNLKIMRINRIFKGMFGMEKNISRKYFFNLMLLL